MPGVVVGTQVPSASIPKYGYRLSDADSDSREESKLDAQPGEARSKSQQTGTGL